MLKFDDNLKQLKVGNKNIVCIPYKIKATHIDPPNDFLNTKKIKVVITGEEGFRSERVFSYNDLSCIGNIFKSELFANFLTNANERMFNKFILNKGYEVSEEISIPVVLDLHSLNASNLDEIFDTGYTQLILLQVLKSKKPNHSKTIKKVLSQTKTKK